MPEPQQALTSVAAGVAAPFLVSYVRWILERALDQGVERLYFLARDGQQLHRIAETLAPSLGKPIELQYLAGSRVTLNLAAAGEISDATAGRLLTGLRRLRARDACERLHLDPGELKPFLSASGFGPDAWTGPLGREGAARLLVLLREPALAELIRQRAEELRARTLGYLASIGFLDPRRIGLVDLGGAGSQLMALGSLRSEAGLTRPAGYLVYRERSSLATSGDDGPLAGCTSLEIYLFDGVSSHGHPPFSGLIPMLETFCAADHGRVIDYALAGSGVRVVTEAGFAESVQAWGLPVARRAMDHAVAHVAQSGAAPGSQDDLIPTLVSNLERFIQDPTPDEARAWGQFPTGVTGPGMPEVLAPPLPVRDLLRCARSRRSPRTLSRWWEGSLVRTVPSARLAVRAWRRRGGRARHRRDRPSRALSPGTSPTL